MISTVADGEDIVVRWRLSGRVNLPFKPPIKPYVVTTTFERDAGDQFYDEGEVRVEVFLSVLKCFGYRPPQVKNLPVLSGRGLYFALYSKFT